MNTPGEASQLEDLYVDENLYTGSEMLRPEYLGMLDEAHIRDKFYDKLRVDYDDNVVVTGWQGRVEYFKDKKSRSSRFYRVPDVVRFYREVDDNRLIQVAYEVKGTVADDWRPAFPEFLTGLEQAIVYLYQNSDFSYLVTPRPSEDYKVDHMKECLREYAPKVGLIFYVVEKREIVFEPEIMTPERNKLNDERHMIKIQNFTKLVLDEKMCEKIERQPWDRVKGGFL